MFKSKKRKEVLRKLNDLSNNNLINSLYGDWVDYQSKTWISTPEYQWKAWVRS